MIHRADVEATLTAYEPETTEEQIDQLYEQMTQAWEDRASEIETAAIYAYKEKTGEWPDGPQRGSIIAQSKQLATDQIMGAYLVPLTQEIVARQAEQDEEDSPHFQALRDPDGWWKAPENIQASQEAQDAVWELWEDESPRFLMLADALFERRLFLGLQLPNRPEHPDYPELKAQIEDAERYWEKRIAATR
ncbi:hypothetical protein [Corynebacterium timonense]|uniref:Uncharacterized protein n=1 Tax=Corynebacterium timonense TaxID=441500 RepID=A0A1H1LGC7_9CORY|nr:hypothetical protein [Corynebacterium timonense]SDR73360.1 hypothetical protein SAMN04488539_0197 [Corynebacterium timonense]